MEAGEQSNITTISDLTQGLPLLTLQPATHTLPLHFTAHLWPELFILSPWINLPYTAYEAFRDLSAELYDIDTRQCARGVTSDDAPGVKLIDGQAKLRELVHLPHNWPLARLTIPLGGLSKQIDRLLEGYCFQILATNRDADAHNGKIVQTATHLTWILAEYLAETIAWLMQRPPTRPQRWCILSH